MINKFESKDDLVSALKGSCHVPYYINSKPTILFRGKQVCDGGFFFIFPFFFFLFLISQLFFFKKKDLQTIHHFLMNTHLPFLHFHQFHLLQVSNKFLYLFFLFFSYFLFFEQKNQYKLKSNFFFFFLK